MLLPLEDDMRVVDQCWENEMYAWDLTLTLTYKTVKLSDNKIIPIFNAVIDADHIYLVVVSEKSRTSIFAGYSIITLYVSVIFVIGRLLRGFLSGAAFKILYEDMPKPGVLLRLCIGVSIARYENDLRREGELYLELIEVLRSTEVMKLITKNSKEVYFFAKRETDEKPNDESKSDKLKSE